jgi:hypothetical protein
MHNDLFFLCKTPKSHRENDWLDSYRLHILFNNATKWIKDESSNGYFSHVSMLLRQFTVTNDEATQYQTSQNNVLLWQNNPLISEVFVINLKGTIPSLQTEWP